MGFFDFLGGAAHTISNAVSGAEKDIGGFFNSITRPKPQTNIQKAIPQVQNIVKQVPIIGPTASTGISIANATPETRGITKGALNTGAGFFTSLLPQQSAGEVVTRDQQGQVQTISGGKAATNIDVAKTALLNRVLLGAGAAAQVGQGAFIIKTGFEQIKDLPTTLQSIQQEKDPSKKAQLATEVVAGLGLTGLGAAHLARGLVNAATSPEAKSVVDSYKSNPQLVNQRGSVPLDLSPEELNMGKALGMSPAEVAKAKSQEVPPLKEELAGGVAPVQKGKLPVEAPAPLQRGNAFNETKRFPGQLQTSFRDLVNNNHAAPVEGKLAAEPFKILDNEGVGAFVKAQSGESGGVYGALRDYFDNKFKQLQDNKIRLNYQKDYLPQIWENPPDQVAKIFADKSLSSKPSFTQSKVIEDYQYGLDHGLTPKFETVSDLVGWYDTAANRAIANKQFVNSLIESKQLLPADEAPKGWKVLDNEMVPTDKLYKVDPRLEKVLSNYLEAAHVEGLNTIARFATRTKNIALGAGIPKTAINSYGLTRLMSSTLSAKNPIGAIFRGMDWVVRPGQAEKFLNTDLGETAKFVKEGLTLSVEDFKKQGPVEGGRIKRTVGKAGDIQQTLFEEPTLSKVVPAFKLRYAKEMFGDLIKSGMEETKARRVAADSANTFFGGINVEELGRNRDFQNVLKSVTLAPDLYTSAIRTGKGVFKGLTYKITDPEFKPYRRFARNLALTYVAANVLNKAISGHFMVENDQGKKFELAAGQDANGKDRYIPIFGSSVDFLRLPEQAAEAVATGNAEQLSQLIRSRLSVPLGVATSLISNTNAFGSPLVGKDKYGNPIEAGQTAKNLAQSALQPFLPQQANAVIGAASGKQSVEQSVAGALELPVRYRTPKTTKVAKGGKRGRPRGSTKGVKRAVKSRIGGVGKTTKRVRVARGRSPRAIRVSTKSRAIKALKI